MRRIVTFDSASADGYFAAPDGGLDRVLHDPVGGTGRTAR